MTSKSKRPANAADGAEPPQANQPAIKADDIAVGDCLKRMAKWPEASVDLVFADPPYNIGFKYDEYDDNRSGDDYVQWTEAWIDGCARLLKPAGSMYILIGDEYAAETRMHLKQLEKQGKLAFRNWIIWHYTFGQNCKIKFNRSHAHLFYCTGSGTLREKRVRGPRKKKGEGNGNAASNNTSSNGKAKTEWVQDVDVKNPPFTFNRSEIAVPSARQTTYADARANPSGKLPDDTWYLRPQQAQEDEWLRYFTPDEDTWYLSRLCGTFKERQGWHPCQLPEALLERIVKLSSNEGDLVFDPFVGSGTTLAVAARLGRHWLGCELSKDYAKKAKQRIKHVQATGETQQTTLNDKGIERGKPKKKAEPDRSPELRKRKPKTATE